MFTMNFPLKPKKDLKEEVRFLKKELDELKNRVDSFFIKKTERRWVVLDENEKPFGFYLTEEQAKEHVELYKKP